MKCEEACDKMIDYIDQQLPQEELKPFEEHMKNCATCQEEFENLEKLIIKLKNIKDLNPSDNLKRRILSNIETLDNKKNKIIKVNFYKKYLYIASSIFVLFSCVYLFKYNQNSNITISIEEMNTTYSDNIPKLRDVREAIIKENYTYSKNITKDMKTKIFRHDFVMLQDNICSIYFENTGLSDVVIRIEDIDGNINNSISILPKTSNTFSFKSSQQQKEQIYSVILECKDKSLSGNLKIETKIQ